MASQIVERIDATRRRLRRIVWLRGAAWLVVGVVGVGTLATLADWMLQVSPGMRLLFLLMLFGCAVGMVYRYWYLPLRGRLTQLDIALEVERLHPELGERLSSTVCFLNTPANDAFAGSKVLRDKVIAEAVTAIEHVDFQETIQTGPTRKIGLSAGVLAFVALALVVANPSDASIALRRLANPFGDTSWPKRTRLLVTNAPASVAIGDPFSFEVEARGVLPQRMQVLYRFGEAEETAPEFLRPVKENVYRGGMEPVTRSFEFSVIGGDAQTEWRKVTAVPAPEVTQLQLHLSYPPYTALPAEEYSEGRGHVKAVVGTKVTLRAKSNKRLVSAELLWDKAGSTPALLDEDGTTLNAEFTVRENAEYRIALHDQEGMNNLNRFPKQFRVQAVPDVAPEVTVEHPASDLEVTREAMLPIRALAKDDFGIQTMELVHWGGGVEIPTPPGQQGAENPEEGAAPEAENENPPSVTTPASRIPLFESEDSPKQQRSEFAWSLAPMQLQHGAVVHFVVEAKDRRDDPGPNVGKSREIRLRVVTKDQFLTQVDRDQQLLREELERVLKLQEAAQRQVADIQKEAEAKGALDQDQIAKLQAAELTQRRIREKVVESDQSLGKQIDRILENLKNNKVSDLETDKRMVMMRSEIGRIVEQHLPPIGQSLTAARKSAEQAKQGMDAAPTSDTEREGASADAVAPREKPSEAVAKSQGEKNNADTGESSAADSKPTDSPDAAKEVAKREDGRASGTPGSETAKRESNQDPVPNLKQAQRHQQEVVSSLQQMLDQLEKWETVAQVVNDARELQRHQADVANRVEKLAAETLGKEQRELNAEQNSEIAKTADRQEQSREQFQRLQRKMSRLAQNAEREDPVAAASLRDAIEQTRESNVGGKMGDASRDIRENKMGDASRQQKEIADALKELVDSLENRREQELARLVKQLKAAEKELEGIAEEQKKLLQKTKEAEKIQDPKQREEELRRLNRRQRELQKKTEEFARKLSRLRAQQASRDSGRAAGKMDQAGQNLEQGKGQQAGQDQADAEQELEQAQQKLAEARQQAEEELASEQLAKISDSIRQIHQRQLGVKDEVTRLDELRKKNGRLTRGELQSVAALSRAQKGLAGEANGLTNKLSAAKVFVLVIEDAVTHMNEAAGLLGERQTDEKTQAEVDASIGQFALLLDSLQQDKDSGRKQGGEQGEQGQGGGGGGGADGIPNIAQIKLLKLLQTQLKARTVALAKLRGEEGNFDDQRQKDLADLSRRQGKLADMVLELTKPAPDDNAEGEETP